MAIHINEITIASKNIDQLKNFYSHLLDDSDVKHHDFFYTIKDQSTSAQVSIVPHNGDKKWNAPWMTLSTDDMSSAIERIKTAGVKSEQIEEFSAPDAEGKPIKGVCFQDPDGRLVMMISKAQ
ncbi:MAG: VOC family protein [Bdellovibrionota bacterium]